MFLGISLTWLTMKIHEKRYHPVTCNINDWFTNLVFHWAVTLTLLLPGHVSSFTWLRVFECVHEYLRMHVCLCVCLCVWRCRCFWCYWRTSGGESRQWIGYCSSASCKQESIFWGNHSYFSATPQTWAGEPIFLHSLIGPRVWVTYPNLGPMIQWWSIWLRWAPEIQYWQKFRTDIAKTPKRLTDETGFHLQDQTYK